MGEKEKMRREDRDDEVAKAEFCIAAMLHTVPTYTILSFKTCLPRPSDLPRGLKYY